MYIRNRNAYKDYDVFEKFEAGIKLLGFEVKALKEGRGHLTGSYIKFVKDEPYLVNTNIPRYSKAGEIFDYNPTRERKLLMHKKELKKLHIDIESKKYILVPLKLYLKGNLIKLNIGLARGKTKSQKKSDLMRKQQQRADERMSKNLRS
jgi:SsrA-binding protein